MTVDNMDKHIANHLRHYHQQSKILEAHRTKVASQAIRNEWLKRQKIQNYQSEYDRLRSSIATNSILSNTGTTTIKHIHHRMKTLEEMGAKAVFKIA